MNSRAIRAAKNAQNPLDAEAAPAVTTIRPARPRPRPALPFVSIIVVNHNGKHFLDDCLSSLAAQTYSAAHREVLVVDNGSSDGSAEHIQRCYPWVRLIRSDKNWGFARGNNVGFQHARGEFIALLNNDAMAEPNWLAALVETLRQAPAIGAVTSKILFRHQPGVINGAGLNLYGDGRGGDRGFRQPDLGQFDEPVEVFGVSGASMLLRRALLDDVGVFDERFGMYYEDLDLAWRARLRGWRFYYTPKSIVHHVHCGTSGEWSPFFLFHVERNRVFASVKNAPAPVVVRALAVFGARAARKWFRVLSFQERETLCRQQALAYVPAGLSLIAHLPEMFWKRLQIRSLRARVTDGAFAHLVTPRP